MLRRLRERFQKETKMASFTVGEETFRYLEITKPDTIDKSTVLIVGLHGFGSHEKQVQSLMDLTLQSAVFLAPRAWYSLIDGGYAWFPISQEDHYFKADRTQVIESLNLLELFIQTALKHYAISSTNVYLLGYSQGASLTLSYLLHKPETIHAAAALSGTLLEELKPKELNTNAIKNKQLFLGQGTLDKLVNKQEKLELKGYLEALSLKLNYKEYPVPHVVSQVEKEDLQAWLNELNNQARVLRQ